MIAIIQRLNKAWRLASKMQTMIHAYYILKKDRDLSLEDRVLYGRLYITSNIRYCQIMDCIAQIEEDSVVKHAAQKDLEKAAAYTARYTRLPAIEGGIIKEVKKEKQALKEDNMMLRFFVGAVVNQNSKEL
jgi:hypothetical protein